MMIFGARCFTGSKPLHTPNHSLHTCGSPEVMTSTAILRNVVENQLVKAGTPHPGNTNWAPLLTDRGIEMM